MLIVENNDAGRFWTIGDPVSQLSYAGEVVVAFDPSKSNMAMVVGTPEGTILNVLEFSGNNRKRGPAMDTTDYCNEVRSFLSEYLRDVRLYCVGVEQAIQKKGNEFYHSSMVLTEIRGNLLNFFLEKFNVKVIEINNWAWKHTILPQGYRQKYGKGSKKWFTECMPESPYAYFFEADVTDCICIYWYMIQKQCANYTIYCDRFEVCNIPYKYCYMPWNSGENVQSKTRQQEVLFNNRFSLEENIAYYVNRILGMFYFYIDVDDIPTKSIYGKSVGFLFSSIEDTKVKVVVCRA